MPVTKITEVKAADGTVTRSETVSHVGLTMRVYYGEIQYMSDVYGTALYADVLVLDAKGVAAKVEKVCVDSCWNACGTEGRAEADADFAVFFAAAKMLAANELRSQFAQAAKRAEQTHHEVVKGKRMRTTVTRGKNAGKEGIVFWIGGDNYGMRVGLALSDKRDRRNQYSDVAWVRGENGKLANVAPMPEIQTFDADLFEVACDWVDANFKRDAAWLEADGWSKAQKLQGAIWSAYVSEPWAKGK